MKLCQVQVTGANPGRYRGLIGANDQEAINKAAQRHAAAGFPIKGHQFSVTSSFTVVGPVVESDADTTHSLALNDGQLAEIEAALRDRVLYLEARIASALHRAGPGWRVYQVQLDAARSSLDAVVSV